MDIIVYAQLQAISANKHGQRKERTEGRKKGREEEGKKKDKRGADQTLALPQGDINSPFYIFLFLKIIINTLKCLENSSSTESLELNNR